MDVASMLAKVPIFSELSQRELMALIREGKEVNHRAGTAIAREGDAGVGFFLILEGKAAVQVMGEHRKTLAPGEYFGEISLLTGIPRTATVVAETPVRLLGLTQWVFKRLVQQHPSMAQKMLRVVASRLRETAEE